MNHEANFKPVLFHSFDSLIACLKDGFREAQLVHPPRWQSMDVSKYEHMSTYEMTHISLAYNLPTNKLNYYRDEVKPNLPWADDHFLRERISGEPINPGTTYKYWPPGMGAGGQHADTHIRETQFDHSYAERYWPRFAGKTTGGQLGITTQKSWEITEHQGIRFRYGDLEDLVNLLAGERLTRQAYLPVWFPEDLGAVAQGKRVPCSLGYHFLVRNDRLDVEYYIRSCDFVRHFRDDVYLTIRLLLWVLEQARLATDDEEWDKVQPGRLFMHIASFHMFKPDYKVLFKERPDGSTNTSQEQQPSQPGVAEGDRGAGTSGSGTSGNSST